MDVERMLVCKTASDRKIGKMSSQGVEARHFADSQCESVWKYMLWHYKNYEGPPSMSALRMRFPAFNFEVVEDQLDYLKDLFFAQVKRRYAIDALRNIADEIDEGEQDIEEVFLNHARSLSRIVPSNTSYYFSQMDERIDSYLTEGTPVGIQMGIPTFDHLTNGIYPEEYITIMGFQGRGKSTLAQWILHNAYWQNRTPMFVSMEMGAKALLRKWDTMALNVAESRIAYEKLKKGGLLPSEIAAWRAKAEEVSKRKNNIIVKDVDVDCTVDYVFAEMQRHQPDIVCIDYITLMKTPRSAGQSMWERVQYLTNNLKQISRTTGIPIIGVAQTNRGSAKGMPEADQVGFGLSIVQDSDIVLSLHQDEEMKKNKRMNVALIKNRDGATNEEALHWDMDHMSFRQWNDATDGFVARDSTTGLPKEEAKWETSVPADAVS